MSRPAPVMPVLASGPQLRLEGALRALGVSAWEREPHDVAAASPDLFWRHKELAVYVDGCQWHGCPEHYRPHRTTKDHGLTPERIALTRHKDRVARAAIAAKGIRVLPFWEHAIRGAGAAICAAKIAEALREPWRR